MFNIDVLRFTSTYCLIALKLGRYLQGVHLAMLQFFIWYCLNFDDVVRNPPKLLKMVIFGHENPYGGNPLMRDSKLSIHGKL